MNNNYVKKISEDASRLGIKKGDTILMHSSLKSLGRIDCTPADVINGIMDAIGGGTLVLPALSYMYCNPENRVFDYYKTPSNVGAIPEYFRTQVNGVRRSLCPTHSCCAIGKYADEITSTHHYDTTPCGVNSSFRKVKELGGKILFLGCGTTSNTSMHAVEELITPDYLWNGEYEYTLIDSESKEHKMMCKAHGFKNVIQRYDRLDDVLTQDEIKTGKILNAKCYLIDTIPMWKKAEEKYRQNQHYFIDFSN